MTGIVLAISGVVGALVAIWIQLCHIETVLQIWIQLCPIETVLQIIAKNDGDNWEWKK